jgi:Xaa-Pro aminopeptidase
MKSVKKEVEIQEQVCPPELCIGRPTLEQNEAYTRVLRGHVGGILNFQLIACSFLVQIAIDTAVFPKGNTGTLLDVLARKNLWQDSLNYLVS